MKALIFVDIQNDYFSGGANPLVGTANASICAAEALLYFRKQNLPIIHVQHISNRPDSTFFLEGSKGAEIHANVMPIKTEKVFIKNSPNAFTGTALDEYLKLKNVDELVICGMMTHMCIDSM